MEKKLSKLGQQQLAQQSGEKQSKQLNSSNPQSVQVNQSLSNFGGEPLQGNPYLKNPPLTTKAVSGSTSEFPQFNMTFQKSSFLQTFTKSELTAGTQHASERKFSIQVEKDVMSVRGA